MKKTMLCIALLLAAANCGNALAIGRPGNLANVEIYDRREQRSLPIYWYQGCAYVVGRPGNEYEIVVRNQADADVLAVVAVDGINVITGETASPMQSGYVIDLAQNMNIAGWRKSMERTAAFYFTSLGDSYAARTGRPDNVGVIGVALYRRKMNAMPISPYSPPARPERDERGYRDAEPAAPAANGGSSQDRAESSLRARPEPAKKSLGTGHGRSESSSARYVGFERRTAAPEEQLTIYYDSYANLVARGVIPGNSRHEPQPFPAQPGPFVPDPGR